MKTLMHRTPVSEALPFDLVALRAHCRVDFIDDDATLMAMGLAAAGELEGFAQIALLMQTVRLTVFDPCMTETYLSLPVGPVADDSPPTVTIDGEAFTAFDFVGGNRPCIRWQAQYFDLTPNRITVEYTAGFGSEASDVPADLAQAVLDQAAQLFDGRSPMNAKTLTTSPHMARIGARYRGVRS